MYPRHGLPADTARATDLATDQPVGDIEPVATFVGPMPTGMTVSHSGQIFVRYPRWGDQVDFTVAQVKDGKPVAYPDRATRRAVPAPASPVDPVVWSTQGVAGRP